MKRKFYEDKHTALNFIYGMMNETNDDEVLNELHDIVVALRKVHFQKPVSGDQPEQEDTNNGKQS